MEATDKSHPEASMDYSDQGYEYIIDNKGNVHRIKTKDVAGILKAENIEQAPDGTFKYKGKSGELIDPEGLGKMYKHKTDIELDKIDQPPPKGMSSEDWANKCKSEAMAQSAKGVKSLDKLRDAYKTKGKNVPDIPKNIRDGMDLMRDSAKDSTATPGAYETNLSSLGIDGGIKQMNDIICTYIESLKWT